MNFVVLTMNVDERTSGGVRALRRLGEELRKRGHQTYHFIVEGDQLFFPRKKDMVVIIPQMFSLKDRPHIKLLVHWLLHRPGVVFPDVSSTWEPSDLVMHFDERYASQDSFPLFVPHVDESVFHNRDNPDDKRRDMNCFYASKALVWGPKKIPNGAVDVSPDAGVKRGDWETLAKLFRRTKIFYTMEETATSEEAALCGARVEYIPNPFLTDIPKRDPIAFYREQCAKSQSQVDRFLELCQEKISSGNLTAVH